MDLASEQRWINFQLRLPQHRSPDPISKMDRLSGLAPTRAACFLNVNSTWKKECLWGSYFKNKRSVKTQNKSSMPMTQSKTKLPTVVWPLCFPSTFILPFNGLSLLALKSASFIGTDPIMNHLLKTSWKNQRLWENLLQSTEGDLTTG